MEDNRIRSALDATPDTDYLEQTIPADPNAVDAVDLEALTTELDTPWPAPEGDLLEQSTPAPPRRRTLKFPVRLVHYTNRATTALPTRGISVSEYVV